MTRVDSDDPDLMSPGDLENEEVGTLGPPLDGPAWLHDVEAESGDEVEVADVYTLDQLCAHELGVDLDPLEEEPELR